MRTFEKNLVANLNNLMSEKVHPFEGRSRFIFHVASGFASVTRPLVSFYTFFVLVFCISLHARSSRSRFSFFFIGFAFRQMAHSQPNYN